MNKDPQSRQYFLTINNPLPRFSHDKIKEIASLKFKTFAFLAMADEIGEQGTPHTHILLCFESAVRCSTVKKQFPTAHIDFSKGSITDVLNYIQKQGKWADTEKAETSVPNSYEELGNRPPDNKGKNRLYSELYKMVTEERLTNAEIIQINTDYIAHLDTMDRIRVTFLQDLFSGTRRLDLEVIYVFGVTGAGKSRSILDEYGDGNCYRVTDYNHPFDGYCIQDVLIFEEFRSSLEISDMLNYLDVYPLQLPARYCQKQACYTKVFITTNLPLQDQYKEVQGANSESWKAFLRRIKKIREYTDIGVYTEYSSTDDYFKRKHINPIKEEKEENPFEQESFIKDERKHTKSRRCNGDLRY